MNVAIGVLDVHWELLVVRVVPLVLCDDAVVRRTLVLIAVAVSYVFVVAIFHRILLYWRYIVYMSGAHMSDEFASWCDGHGIKLELIPKAHHMLAIQERNHAVRRNQLLTYETMYPLDSLKKAIAYTLVARNRLWNVKGYSPIQRVLGFQRHILSILSDADYRLSEQAAASDPTSSLSQDLERRREA